MRDDVQRWLHEVARALDLAFNEIDAPRGDISWHLRRCRDTVRMDGELQAASLRHLVKDLAELLRGYPARIPEGLRRTAMNAPGRAFPFVLLRLEAFALGLPEAPRWQSVIVSPLLELSPEQKTRVARADLVTADEFGERFAQLLSLGYPWIDSSAAGVLHGALLVMVEMPTCTQANPDPTSIRVSGPPEFVRQRVGWDIDDILLIEDSP